MVEIVPISLMVLGVIFSGIGIGLLWKHPNKWKVIGTVCAIIGVIINIVNVYLHVSIT